MLIAEIPRNMRERIRVEINEFKKHRFINCRVWFQDEQGKWHPTRKGIALKDEVVDEVIEALKKAKGKLNS